MATKLKCRLATVTANRRGPPRRATLHGREHLVVDAVLIRPGVLSGSKGPLYYPPGEVARAADAWNGVPVVRDHPTRNGVHVSARSPEVTDRDALGSVFNARVRPRDGALTAEVWLNVEAVRRKWPALLDKIGRGEPVELSTGLFTDNIPAANGATCPRTGAAYARVATNHRPDHLAILTTDPGACSVRDGCGLGVANCAAGCGFDACTDHPTKETDVFDDTDPTGYDHDAVAAWVHARGDEYRRQEAAGEVLPAVPNPFVDADAGDPPGLFRVRPPRGGVTANSRSGVPDEAVLDLPDGEELHGVSGFRSAEPTGNDIGGYLTSRPLVQRRKDLLARLMGLLPADAPDFRRAGAEMAFGSLGLEDLERLHDALVPDGDGPTGNGGLWDDDRTLPMPDPADLNGVPAFRPRR